MELKNYTPFKKGIKKDLIHKVHSNSLTVKFQ